VKVLHVYRTYFPDGASGMAEAIRQICTGSRNAGVESSVFALSPRPQPRFLERGDARVGRARSWGAPASCDLGGPEAFALFKQMVAEVDVVNYHFPWPFADVLHWIVSPRAAAVMTWHSDIVRQKWLGRLYAPLMNRTIRGMDTIVATSPTYAATSPILTRADVKPRVRVIPLGLDEQTLPDAADAGIFARLGISQDEPYFLFVGATRYYKGLHYLIEAAASVAAKVVIAGSGQELDELRDYTARHPAARVIFAGRVTNEEKVALLQSCVAFVLPSHVRSEAYGMVLVEASIYGRPMVTCEIGSGTSYVNVDRETGLVVESRNSAALAGAMNLLLADRDAAERFGANARHRYEKLFTGRAMGTAYADLYEELRRTKSGISRSV
jgi:glycosyltransferase involved in cell wall biosynthesis